MATLELTADKLTVHIHGWDKLLALRSAIEVPLAHVINVVARPADARFDEMKGLRLAGGYWPKSFAAGYFWVTGGPGGERQASLEKLEEARKLLEPSGESGQDPYCGGHFAAAQENVNRAIDELKKGLEAAKLPETQKHMAFYSVHDPEKTIGLDLEHERIRRMVVQIDDHTPEEAVALIQKALGR